MQHPVRQKLHRIFMLYFSLSLCCDETVLALPMGEQSKIFDF